MRIRNKDGTINSIPIVIIFTVLVVGIYIFLFGFGTKTDGNPIIGGDSNVVTTTKKQTTTINFCNDCSMKFISESIDVSTNGEVDIGNLLIVDKMSKSDVTVSSSDLSIFKVSPGGSSYKLITNNVEGSAILTAKYSDMKMEMVINVVHPSKQNVKFKYDYYFVSKNSTISPEIETYPYGLDTKGMTFDVSPKDILGFTGNKNTIRGNKVGEATYTLKLNNMQSSTKIYSVNNLITVKVNTSGQYKEERSLNPSGSSFDMIIQFEDNNKENYDNNNLNISFDRNDLNANVTYVKRHNNINSYIYHIDNLGESGKSIMRIELPDGSFTLFEINK